MNIGIIGAFVRGWTAALSLRGLVFLRWAVNLACAIFLVLPIWVLLADTWDESLTNEQVFQTMPMDQITELIVHQGDKFAMFAWIFLPILLFFVLANVFMSAGIMKAVNDGKPASWPEFFSACSGYFFSMVRVIILCLILAALFVALPNALLEKLVDRVREGATSAMPVLWTRWIKAVVMVLLISGVVRIYDYARLLVCRDKKAWRAFKQAISFTHRNRFGSFSLWILFVGISLGSGLVYAKLDLVSVTSTTTILLALLLGQVLLLFKSLTSVATLAGQHRFLVSRTEQPTPPKAATPEPVVNEPATPEPVTPEPAMPESASPEAASQEPDKPANDKSVEGDS